MVRLLICNLSGDEESESWLWIVPENFSRELKPCWLQFLFVDKCVDGRESKLLVLGIV